MAADSRRPGRLEVVTVAEPRESPGPQGGTQGLTAPGRAPDFARIAG